MWCYPWLSIPVLACYRGQPPTTPFPLPIPRQRPPISFCSPILGILSPATQTLLLVELHQFLAPEPTFHIGTLLPSLSSLLILSSFISSSFFSPLLFSFSGLWHFRLVIYYTNSPREFCLLSTQTELPPGALKFLSKLLPLPLLPRGHRELSVGLLLL